MNTKHTPEGEWFYDVDNPDDSQRSVDDILDTASNNEIVEVGGAREVWRGFGFSYVDDNGGLASAWYATEAEAGAALEKIERKQRENEAS